MKYGYLAIKDSSFAHNMLLKLFLTFNNVHLILISKI